MQRLHPEPEVERGPDGHRREPPRHLAEPRDAHLLAAPPGQHERKGRHRQPHLLAQRSRQCRSQGQGTPGSTPPARRRATPHERNPGQQREQRRQHIRLRRHNLHRLCMGWMGRENRCPNNSREQPRAERVEQEQEQAGGEPMQHGTHQMKGPGREPRRLVGEHPREPRHGPEVAHLNVAATLGGSREEVGHKEPRPALGRAQRLGAADEQMVILREAMLARRQVEPDAEQHHQQQRERAYKSPHLRPPCRSERHRLRHGQQPSSSEPSRQSGTPSHFQRAGTVVPSPQRKTGQPASSLPSLHSSKPLHSQTSGIELPSPQTR